VSATENVPAAPVESGVVHPTGRRARIGPPRRWRAVLRAEIRKTTSVKLWWVLVVPVVLLSLLTSQFGSLLSLILPTATEESPVRLMVGVASAMSVVSILAAMFGTLTMTGEFRHRTATNAYLTGARVQVLGAKVVVAAVVGALYGLVMAVLGPLLGGAALGQQTLPGPGELVLLGLAGVMVCALWGVIGVAIGTLVKNQVGAIAIAVGYLILGENVISVVLGLGDSSTSDPTWVSRLSSFLPGNAGDLALYQPALAGAGDESSVRQGLELLAGATAPPPGWVSALVLVAWTVAAVALAVVVGGRRDVT
jgi:ABC-2 type transport system permease protein